MNNIQININTDEEEAISFYSDDFSVLSDDKALFEDATKEAKEFEEVLKKTFLQNSSYLRGQLYNHIYDLTVLDTRKEVYSNGRLRDSNDEDREMILGRIKSTVSYLRFCRAKYNNPLTKDELYNLFFTLKEQAENDLNEDYCPSYVSSDLDLGHITWYEDGVTVNEEEEEEEVQIRDSKEDSDWSYRAVMAVFKRMDPTGCGRATQPMQFTGHYTTKNGTRHPLRHSTIKQSLYWVWKVLLKDTRLTYEDKSALYTFLDSSYKSLYTSSRGK
ncbi:hypothetical protein GF373_17255 [bacterium]|nr:hypothetical protein [bacterium]